MLRAFGFPSSRSFQISERTRPMKHKKVSGRHDCDHDAIRITSCRLHQMIACCTGGANVVQQRSRVTCGASLVQASRERNASSQESRRVEA